MLAVLTLCLPSALPLLAPMAMAAAAPAAQDQPQLRLAHDQVAVWNGGSVSVERFDRFLGANARYQETGADALTHILQLQLVQTEAESRGLKADPMLVEARLQDAKDQVEAAGKKLSVLLAARQMGMTEFRALLADSLLHEELVRRDYKIAPETAVTPEQLEQWSQERIAVLLEQAKNAPAGMVLDVPPYRVSEQDLGAILRQTMGNEDLVDRVEQLVLMEALPKWASKAGKPLTDDILYREIEWRRKRVEENPAYAGATYEGLLQVKNSSIELVLQSDELRVVGYMRMLAEERFPDSWFDTMSQKERDDLEQQYGATRHIGWILLRAHEQKADALDLTFEEAAEELTSLRGQMKSADDFRRLASEYSEDEVTRRRAGMLGWVHMVEKGVAPALCNAAFEAPGTGIFGPVKIVDPNPFASVSGMALVLIDDIREAPTEAEFRALVRRGMHNGLRSTFLEELNLHTRWQRRFPEAY